MPAISTHRTRTLPDPARQDGGLTFLSTWSTGTPERQQATLDAIAKAWESRPWPHEGLLSYTVYAGVDGSTVMHRSQWRDDAAYQDFFASSGNGRDARNTDIDAAVPGIERLGLNKTRLYRSWTDGGGREGREPGAIVVAQADFEGPGDGRPRAWADAAIEALDAGPADGRGLYAAHFHLSTDGGRVLNYAEWESEEAHAAQEGARDEARDGAVARYRFAYGFVPSKA
ncbi:antibiotic biosynthesis monooxygenase [Streptomyces sp. NPDC058308]|uniref:antibiotic biosynthesis monooxygenase n=1 Tax=Streptomyces sp. NPDC058308 TaxID=3346440 RepID=UPI0036E1CB24